MAALKKLDEWHRAGLVDSSTVERIRAYETSRSRPYALYVIGGLGALCIVLGVISLVAANWADIPRSAKMLIMLAVVGGTAHAAWRMERDNRPWPREILLVVFQGLVLAGIAFIGQTYNLGGKPWQALLAWALITSPALLLMGRQVPTALAWLTSINVSVSFVLVELVDRWDGSELVVLTLLFTYGGVVILGHIRVGSWAWLARARPAIASTAAAAGWAAATWLSVVAQHAWYIGQQRMEKVHEAFLVACFPVGIMLAWLVVDPPHRGERPVLLTTWRVLIIHTVVAAALPVGTIHPNLGFLSALSVLAHMAILAWFAYVRGAVWLFNLATGLMALRMLAVFVEVFGSLLATGVGLIVGGVAILWAAWFWVRKTREWRVQMRGHGGEP